MQKINEITGVARGKVKDAKGYFNKQCAADALAAFKHEPLKPSVGYVGKAYSTSIPTQKTIDDMLGIVENTPHTRLELLRKRAEIRNVFNGIQAYSFLVFNLLCAPCFAAIGAIKREMNSPKWTWFAVAYQCGFAYIISLMIYQFGCLFTGNVHVVGLIFAVAALAGIIYMLARPYKEATKLTKNVKIG